MSPSIKSQLNRQLPAAVLNEFDPGAISAARVVPKGARIVKIGKAIAGYVATPSRVRRQIGLLDLRILEIERLIVSRFGKLRVDTDDADLVAEIIAAHAEPNRAALWIGKACPTINAQEAISAGSGRRWTATRLGKALNLTLAERTLLGIKTIRPADVTPREAAAYAAARKREMERARIDQKRRAAGIQPRPKADAATLEAAALGISRRTLFNRRKRGLHPSVGNTDQYTSNVRVHLAIPAWLTRAFNGPSILISEPSMPPDALRIGALVAAAQQRGRQAMRLH